MTAPIKVAVAEDICALPLVRRLSAMLDREPMEFRVGDALPRGWHAILFNAPTMQKELRSDGSAALAVDLSVPGLTRLMLGGRRQKYCADIPIGAPVRRLSRPGTVLHKTGRSGAFAVVTVEHQIFVDGSDTPAVIESQDYILRPPEATQPLSMPTPAGKVRGDVPSSSTVESLIDPADILCERLLVPDERMLFRYSAVTDNPHRIHYDLPYASGTESYPRLVVNGSIPFLFLLEMLGQALGHQPAAATSRNIAPMYCGEPLRLFVSRKIEDHWRLWAEDRQGNTVFEARVF